MLERKVLVVYDTRFGNTWKLAEALTRGFERVPGIRAACRPLDEVHADELAEAALLVIGGPTEFFSESRHLKEFFTRIGGFDLHGKYGFAFDTHAAGPLRGSAARAIERDLKGFGVTLLEPRQSAITVAPPAGARRGPSSERPSVLAPGAEAHFEEIGSELGKSLLEHPTLEVEEGRFAAPT